MYAIIKTGGKQYKVTEGAILRIEKLPVEAGNTFNFSDVLLVADGNTVKVGIPYLEESKVTATVQEHGRGEKIKIIKMKRRKHYRKQMGHRQAYTEVKITTIVPDVNNWVAKETVSPATETVAPTTETVAPMSEQITQTVENPPISSETTELTVKEEKTGE